MKIRAILLALSIALGTGSCNVNQSVNSDFSTGAYSRGNGIGCESVSIQINGENDNRNEFFYGERVHIVFNDLIGLVDENGKKYPGVSMLILQNEKDTMFFEPNLLADQEEGMDFSPLQLQGHFRAVFPYQSNEDYKVLIKVWDEKGDGEFTYELPFTIKENKLLTIKNSGFNFSNIYLWDKDLQQPVFEKNIDSKHSFILILEGIEGLATKNERVFPIFSLQLLDGIGNKILSSDNLFSDYETEGLDPMDVKAQLTAKFSFSEGQINNPCRLKVKLSDNNSAKEITISTELVLK